MSPQAKARVKEWRDHAWTRTAAILTILTPILLYGATRIDAVYERLGSIEQEIARGNQQDEDQDRRLARLEADRDADYRAGFDTP